MHVPVETTERVDPMNNMAAWSCIVAKVEGHTDIQKLSLHPFLYLVRNFHKKAE